MVRTGACEGPEARPASLAPKVVDAHQHFWWRDRARYAWLDPNDPVLARDFTPEELRPQLPAAGVQQTVVVQADPSVEETQFLLEMAEQTDFVIGVVGWVDLERADVVATIDDLQQSPYFVGIRPMLQDLSDAQWVLRPAVVRHLHALAERGLAVDWLVTPRELPAILTIMQEIPTLTAVIDHLAKPHGMTETWAQTMAALAQFPHCACKLSGLATLDPTADGGDWLRQAIQWVWDGFGPNRLIFGSDWPVALSGGWSYDTIIARTRQWLPTMTVREEAAIFGANAQRWYGLTPT